MPSTKPNPKVRSRAYPGIDLREAIGLVRLVDRQLGRAGHDRDVLSKALGYSSGRSGAAGRKIAALGHFDLLEKDRGLYKPSKAALELIDPQVEDSRRAHLEREAFLAPKIFREVIEKYRPEGRVPKDLAAAIGQFGISDAARKNAAEVLLISGRFVGMLDDENRILENVAQIRQAPRRKGGAEKPVADRVDSRTNERPETEPMRLGLSHGTALLQLPRTLTEADVQLLKMQIDVLATSQRGPGEIVPYLSSRRK